MKYPTRPDPNADEGYDDSPLTREELNALAWELIERGAWEWADGSDRLGPDGSHAVTVREIIKVIEAYGWYLSRQKSSHRQFKHPTKPGLVTVAGHPPKTLAPKTVKSILRQVGLAT